jgi:V8-like Glu-specific endopeptidase
MANNEEVRYSKLRPLTIQEKIEIAMAAIYFFNNKNYDDVRSAMGRKVWSRPEQALTVYEFLIYVESLNIFADPMEHKYRIWELLLSMSRSNILLDAGIRVGEIVGTGNQFYFAKELSKKQSSSIFWLIPALGSEFLHHIYSKLIVHISGKNGNGDNVSGTGIIIHENFILTCGHVIKEMKIDEDQMFFDKEFKIVCQKAHDTIDVGVIKVDKQLTRPDGLGFQNPKIAETVYTIGYPKVPMSKTASLIMQKGEVTNEGIETTFHHHLFLYSAIARPGNSGGPIISEDGHVIGIVSEDLISEDQSFTMPHYAGIRTSDIDRAMREMEIEVDLPIENFD